MNKWLGMGRLTKDPNVTYAQKDNSAIARFTLAVDRRTKEKAADFISCVAFGKSAEFAEKYLKKGTKIALEGRIQTGSYKNKEGQTVYTTDIVVETMEFAESKSSQDPAPDPEGEFVNIPEGIDDELPFQ